MKRTKTLILAALLAALTCAATMIIKIPTPTMGYIHPGDAFVLLSGILLGPAVGGLSAGIGSMFADIFSGYFTYAPATFLIKALTAVLAAVIFQRITRRRQEKAAAAAVIAGGIIGELFMVVGYFVFEIFLLGIMTGGFNAASLTAGIAAAAAGIGFNAVQGVFGVIIAAVLYPIVRPLYVKALD